MSPIERRCAYSGAVNVSTPLRKQTEGEMQRSISFMCKSSTSSFLVLLIVVLTAVPAMFGQAYFGTVSGELTDATSAVVTGAKVILTDQEKGFSFQTISDNSGRYLFRSIPPGEAWRPSISCTPRDWWARTPTSSSTAVSSRSPDTSPSGGAVSSRPDFAAGPSCRNASLWEPRACGSCRPISGFTPAARRRFAGLNATCWGRWSTW